MDTTDILIKIRQIMRNINLESKRIDKDHGVSIPQVLCLQYLKRSPNFQSTQNNLQNFLMLNSSTINGIIERLEKKGLIARLPKTGDKRKVQLTLTSRGDKLLASLPPLLHDRLDRNLSSLGEEPAKQLQYHLNLLTELMEIKAEG